MPPTDDVSRDLADLQDRLRDCRRREEAGDDARTRVVRSVSSWSPRMQFVHAALATSSICRFVERILAGDPGCLPPGAPSAPLAMILSTGSIPRGRAEAPEPLKPEAGVGAEEVRDALAECSERVQALAPRAEEIATSETRLPHFALGPMTPAQWLRFARIHFDHHLAIARETESAPR
jgi:hypothetical protein